MSQARIALAARDQACLEGIEEPVDQRDAVPGPRQGIRRLVVARGRRVEAVPGEPGVLVGAVQVVGISGPHGDGPETRKLSVR